MPRNPRTQDISWFLDLHETEQLDLDPPYQRRSVWSAKDKRFFIDTILNNFPAPPIFLHKTLDENGRSTYHVVDGKQRLQTIIDFSENKIRVPDDFVNVNLRKLRFKDLDQGTKTAFWNYEIVVEMLPDVSGTAVTEIFERINRNSRKLMPQELRHAKYDGWFIDLAENEANREEWKRFGIATVARSKRMADVQFVSELLMVIIKRQIQGFDQDAIDELYAEYEDITEHPSFDEETFAETVQRIKSLLLGSLEIDPSLQMYFKVLGHFYSLWSFLVLEGVEMGITPERLARQYKAFVTLLEQIGDDADSQPTDPQARAAQEYAANFRGASTELPQRQARHSALQLALAGDPG